MSDQLWLHDRFVRLNTGYLKVPLRLRVEFPDKYLFIYYLMFFIFILFHSGREITHEICIVRNQMI